MRACVSVIGVAIIGVGIVILLLTFVDNGNIDDGDNTDRVRYIIDDERNIL